MPVFKLNDVFAGRYLLSELIGEGGFSEVWKAQDQMADDAVVALKIYAPEKGLDDFGVRQFRKEFSLTHHLSHPHLLRVYHFDISDGSPYLIMPYCSHGSLSRIMSEGGAFSERQVALVFCQIGSALEELHSQEPPILHQDIKPDNILVSQPENFLLADFGISSQIRHTLRKSTSESKSLTVAYAPPERFDRFLVTDSSGDIFSLGVTLFEMCTKTIPWDGSGGQSLLKGGHIPNLPERYSPELNKLLQACMSHNRGKRPSANELHLRGKNFLENGRWDLPEKKKEKPGLKVRMVPILLVAAIIALLAVGAFWMFQDSISNVQDNKSRKMASAPAEDQELTSMVDKMMEDELKILARRTVELEEANRRLMESDSANNALLKRQEELIKKYQNNIADKPQKQEVVSAAPAKKSVASTSSRSLPAKEKEVVPDFSPKDLEKQLNKISEPGITKVARAAWKQETMNHFSEGAVRILDETEGTPKQYSASIFLNLLYNVPHQIVVKEVKTDKNRKVTELRLTMEERM